MIDPGNRQSSVSRPARFTFWLVALLTLGKLNETSVMAFGTGQLVTIGLALGCALLCLTIRVPAGRALGAPGFLIVAALGSYLLIGWSVLLVTGNALTSGYVTGLRPGLAILVITATALGASAMLHRVGVEPLLKGVLAVLAVMCITILASPWLTEQYFRSYTAISNAAAQGRFAGVFASPNLASAIACYTVVLALSLLHEGRYRTFAGLAMLLGISSIILTFSRTAILSLALILLFSLGTSLAHFCFKRTSVGGPFAVISLVAVLFGLSIINAEHLVGHLAIHEQQLERLIWFANPEYSNDKRSILLHLGLSQIAESPLFGHGITRFHHLEGGPVCNEDLIIKGTVTDRVCGVHNTYLMLLGEAGIIPLAFLLLFMGSLLWRWWTLPKSAATNAVAGFIFVFAVQCIVTDAVLYFPDSCFILGLSCAMMAHAERESRARRRRRTLRTPPASGPMAGGITSPAAD